MEYGSAILVQYKRLVVENGISKFWPTVRLQECGETKTGDDFPERCGGYYGGSFVSSGESFDPSC
jgi:hypothetical protein